MSDCGNCGCPTGISTPSNGVDGLNSFTTTTADFVVPSVGGNVTITVSSLGQLTGQWAGAGQLIFIESAGWYRVVSSTDTTITVTNPSEFTSENAALAAVASTVVLGQNVSPSGEKGTSGSAGSAVVLDHRTADGGPFLNGVAYFPATVPSSFFPEAIISDSSGNNLQTTIPANTLENVGDFLRVKLVVGVQSPSAVFNSYGAMKFSIWWDSTEIWSANVGTFAFKALGSQGYEVVLDISMVDNSLIATGNVQVSSSEIAYENSVVGISNIVWGPLGDLGGSVAKRTTLNETLSSSHVISVRAKQDIGDSSIADIPQIPGLFPSTIFSYDNGYVFSYEVIKQKKQV